jgi:hypothetical protein
MEKKQLLDSQGNPITPERMKEMLQEIYDKQSMKPLLERCEWEEDGKLYHCWKINTPAGEGKKAVTGYTNDAGAEQIQNAMKEWVLKEYGDGKE